MPASLRRADVITAPTRVRAPEPPHRARRRPWPGRGRAPRAAGRTSRRGRLDEEALRARYEVPGPFLLYPAATYPHKNHLVLLEALARLPEDRPSSTSCSPAAPGWGRRRCARAIDQRGLRSRVIRTGRVPDADRDGLLRLADALVFPSRYEGFGAPVPRGHGGGTPVLAAAATALPEVVGSAGLLLDPDDPQAWADGHRRRCSTMPTLRERLVAAGHVRARDFTAQRSSAALVARLP